jgi:hypothetical protein
MLANLVCLTQWVGDSAKRQCKRALAVPPLALAGTTVVIRQTVGQQQAGGELAVQPRCPPRPPLVAVQVQGHRPPRAGRTLRGRVERPYAGSARICRQVLRLLLARRPGAPGAEGT